MKIKELNFKQIELEQENKSYFNQINKHKIEIEDLNKALDNIHKELVGSGKIQKISHKAK